MDVLYLQEQLEPISGEAVYDDFSPQLEAIRWLVYDDPANYTIQATDLSYLEERYVMVLLYFALNGMDWVENTNYLTSSPVCSWDHIECNSLEVVTDVDMGTYEALIMGVPFFVGTNHMVPGEIVFVVVLIVLILIVYT